jgi:hypothetical protein
MILNMKPYAISFLVAVVCFAANAKDKSIKEFVLDERTVYTIPVSQNRVTTISFPGSISAIDAAQVTADPKKAAPFQIAHAKGSTFFSVRSLSKKTKTNVNVRWNRKTYVLELEDSDEPLLSVIFVQETEKAGLPEAVAVSPNRLLALLDKAKSYRLLRSYHPDAVSLVEYRNYDKEPRVLDSQDFQIQIDEAFRFNPEDTLVLRLLLKNKTDTALRFSPNGFELRVGDRTYPQSVSDASGIIPPKGESSAYFAVTGTPNGGRNDISLKNDFFVILDAKPVEETKEAAK